METIQEEDKKQKAFDMMQEGLTGKQIAIELGVSEATVSNWKKLKQA